MTKRKKPVKKKVITKKKKVVKKNKLKKTTSKAVKKKSIVRSKAVKKKSVKKKKPVKKKVSKKKKSPAKKKSKKTVSKKSALQEKNQGEIDLINHTKRQLEKKLNKTEKLFSMRYVARMGNGTKAYLDIKPNATSNSAHTEAHRFLRKPTVKAYISLVSQETLLRNKIDADYVLEKQKEIVESNIMDLFNVKDSKNGFIYIKSIKDFPKHLGWMIKEIYSTEAGVRIKLLDKQKALEALGKFGNMYEDSEDRGPKEIKLSFDKALDDV